MTPFDCDVFLLNQSIVQVVIGFETDFKIRSEKVAASPKEALFNTNKYKTIF